MQFRNASKAEILAGILRFYRTQFSLPEESVFPTVQPLAAPAVQPGGDFWISVCVDDGTFPFEEQDDEQLLERCGFIVTAYIRMELDWVARDVQFLSEPHRGALKLQQQLLRIVGNPLKDTDGIGTIASRVFASGTIRPTYDSEQRVGWTGIRIAIEFDWHIAGADDLGDD